MFTLIFIWKLTLTYVITWGDVTIMRRSCICKYYFALIWTWTWLQSQMPIKLAMISWYREWDTCLLLFLVIYPLQQLLFSLRGNRIIGNKTKYRSINEKGRVLLFIWTEKEPKGHSPLTRDVPLSLRQVSWYYFLLKSLYNFPHLTPNAISFNWFINLIYLQIKLIVNYLLIF